MSSKEETPTDTPKPRRRWKRWVFGLLLAVAAFLIWFNGPGIRWTVKKLISQQLETQKLSGTFKITGTALRGISIHKLSLVGESKIQSVESELLKLTWTPSSLFKKRIDSLSLEKLHLVIDPKAPPLPKYDDPNPDKKNRKSLSESLDFVRKLIRPSDISLTDLHVEVIDQANVSLASLKHSPNADTYIFKDLRTQDHLNRSVYNPLTTLTWTKPGFSLDEVTLLPKLSLQNIIFHPEKKASGEFLIDGKKISLSSDFQSNHRLVLDSPPLDLPVLIELINPKLLEEKHPKGNINALEVDTSKGLINLQATNLQWGGNKLDSASFEARTPDMLSPFEQDVEIKAQLEDRLTINGTITPSPEILDSSADISFTFRDPAAPTVTGDLSYGSRQAHLEASTLQDLRLKATYFADTSTFEASATSQLEDASQLDPKLTGPLIFTLNAKGDLKEKSHSGMIKLDHLQINQEKLTNTTTKAIISYDWPQFITVNDLTISSPEGQLQGDLQWQDDILTISKLDLVDDSSTLLSATAKLPIPLHTQSLDTLVHSTEPLSLEIKSQPLSFEKISSFIPLPKDLSGVFLVDLSLSGSPAEPTLNGFANIDNFRTTTQPDLPPIDLELNLETKDQKLLFTTITSEPNGPLLNLDGNLPFLPHLWIENKTSPDENSPINLHLYSPKLDLQRLNQTPNLPDQLAGFLETDITLSGSLAKPILNGFLKLNSFRLANQPTLPPIGLDLNFKTNEQNLLFSAKVNEPNGLLLNLDGTLPFLPQVLLKNEAFPEDSPIDLRIASPNLDLKLFNKLPNFPEELSGILKTNLTLTGSIADPNFKGFLKLDSFQLSSQPTLPPLNLNLDLKTEKQNLLVVAEASETDSPLLNLEGSLPFLPEVWLQNKKHPADSPLSLRLTSQNLDLKLFNQVSGLPEELEGILRTDLTLTGSLAQPKLGGFLRLDSFRLQNQPGLSPVDFNLKLQTENQELLLTADASDPNGPLFDVTGNLPFLPKAWIERKTNPSDSPLNIRATSPDLDLRRIQPFVPTIKQITGQAKLDLLVAGTISSPKVSGSAKASIATMRLAKSPISTFRNTKLNATFQDETITIQPSLISASGGTATVSGTVKLEGSNPIFNIDLQGQHILLHRTPDYSFRGHPKLKLSGPFSEAKVSGSLQITESLLYKDLEILPFGVPRTTEIPQPNLPTFSRKETAQRIAQSDEGILGWSLDIDVTTADPVLIRGNLARGEVTGEVKVTGTIGEPKTDGTVTSNELKLDLPFSDLEVQSGVVTLRPESLTDPLIDLRGSSVIGQYTVQVYLTGPVQNPTLILTSDPPLPESEIMLLLATGSASEQLEDRQVASQKALQYLIEGLRRRNRGKDKSLFQRLLKNSDQIELSLGDTNQFSGRRFSSATLEIDDQWDFTTQIDEAGQTRALVVFSVRLK